jgi:outer membrane protein
MGLGARRDSAVQPDKERPVSLEYSRSYQLTRIPARRLGRILLLAFGSALAAPAAADWLLTQTPFHDTEPGSVGIGYGARFGQSPYVGIGDIGSVYSDYNYDLVPLYLYEGDYLFAHGVEWGVHLFKPRPLKLDLVARYRFDRLQPEASEFFEGMSERKQTVDGGLALTLDGGWGRLSLSAITDLMGRHEGQEYDLTYQYPWQRGRWTLSPSVSLAYLPGAAANWRVGLNVTYHWLKNWYLFANTSYEGLADEIADSPLVERKELFSAYFGASWTLGSVKEVARHDEDTRLWSWRVNAGYTVSDTFSQVLLGNVKQHGTIDTYVAGFTLGRLLKDGKRGDVWGRVSINRRFENDFQKDFNEYVAYVMAMGSGYSPWTNRELFRFGFGLGISYAERVPAIEQYKQARHDEQTSHWLNYMEAQVDFPLSALFGSRGSKNCYVGLTLIHRSGIFGRSDLFNSTKGGSEALTGHLECKM